MKGARRVVPAGGPARGEAIVAFAALPAIAKIAALAALAAGCARGGPSDADVGAVGASSPLVAGEGEREGRSPAPRAPVAPNARGLGEPRAQVLRRIAAAEQDGRAADVPPGASRSDDVDLRRAAARAFARILPADDEPLRRALNDEDGAVVGWAMFGLGEACKGREDDYVRAIATRLSSVAQGAARAASPGDPARPPGDPAPVADRVVSIGLRALGRCGGAPATAALRAWLAPSSGAARSAREDAAYALGEIAARQGYVDGDTAASLLAAVEAAAPLDAALYPFERAETVVDGAIARRVLRAAQAALGRPGPSRAFAVRVLGRTNDSEAIGLLRSVVLDEAMPPLERVEAIRGLARGVAQRRAPDERALAEAFEGLVAHALPLAGDRFGVVLEALRSLNAAAAERAVASLWSVARASVPEAAGAPARRRLSALRCGAAAHLARRAWDADVLQSCDVADGESGERARLGALDRGALTRERRAAWTALLESPHARVQEEALELVANHGELGTWGREALAAALASGRPGRVATAAGVLRAHPERAYVLAASERRAALDPAAPAPTATPVTELEPQVASALRDALARFWRSDRVETRIALLEAARAVGLPEGIEYARRACSDADPAIRARAAKALAVGAATVLCPAPGPERAGGAGDAGADGPPAERGERPAPGPTVTRIRLDTDAGVLALRLDATLAPTAVARIAARARGGVYAGQTLDRVVAGFAVEMGDPDGDGYGGYGGSLRGETSPVPFDALDVGLDLAGRDMGSGRLFVTLGRHPHLDGRYVWLGRAEGDWDAVAEGDVVRDVRVDEGPARP